MGVNASIEGSNPSFSAETAPVAVVSGANRGIGREVACALALRGFTTVLRAREPGRGEAAARELAARGGHVLPWQLDVADGASVAALGARVKAELGAVHVL